MRGPAEPAPAQPHRRFGPPGYQTESDTTGLGGTAAPARSSAWTSVPNARRIVPSTVLRRAGLRTRSIVLAVYSR
jgi:hypothetical protein